MTEEQGMIEKMATPLKKTWKIIEGKVINPDRKEIVGDKDLNSRKNEKSGWHLITVLISVLLIVILLTTVIVALKKYNRRGK